MADDPVTGRDEVYDESREPRAGMPTPLRHDRQPIEEVLNGALGCRCGSTLFASSEMAVELRRCGYGDVPDRRARCSPASSSPRASRSGCKSAG